MESPLHRLAYMVPILLAVWFFDAWITDDGRAGWERNTVRNSVARFENDTRGRVAIMGSSTSKDWLSERTLEGLLGRKRGEVIDAHINGCHQGCTWAEVQKIRQLHHQKRCRPSGKDRCSPPTEKRFDAVFFGTNLFQLCEFAHSKRVLQHAMLTPVADVPALFGRYLHADQPLQWIGRYAGIRLSDAYGDTQALRDYWGRRFLGSPRAGKAHAWYRADAPPGDAAPLSCAYDADAVALKRAFTEGLLDDLGELADHVYLMLLPDRSRALDDPEHRRRWAAHLALHQAIADARPWVTVVDLVTDGAARPEHFRDGFHLNEAGMKIQQALFAARLKALGVAKP
ncbi:MAG: hypothetical protein KC583_00910 [Myxococcales bacterium]|nr:hypothetical protein [Myxococcales bacterium]